MQAEGPELRSLRPFAASGVDIVATVTLPPLATVEDVADRMGVAVSDPDARLRLTRLLADASAAVRVYTGRQWATGTVVLTVRPRGNYVTLPSKVTSITSVVDPNLSGQAVPFEFDQLDRLYLWPAVYREAFDYEFCGMPTVVTITYEAGDDPAPDAVVAVVCQMAMRAYGVDPLGSGHQQESIAGYSYSVGVAAASGAVGMLPDERSTLDAFRSLGSSSWLGLSA